MKKDSMESIGKVSEAKAGKIVFGNCLYVYKKVKNWISLLLRILINIKTSKI